MAMKKTVRGKRTNVSRMMRFFYATKNKLRDSTDFVKKQQSDLLGLFRQAKTSTKVIVVSFIVGVILLGVMSLSHSVTTISDKQSELDDLDRQIAEQQKINDDLDYKLNGDLADLYEEAAREKLDMVYPNEQEFINNGR